MDIHRLYDKYIYIGAYVHFQRHFLFNCNMISSYVTVS